MEFTLKLDFSKLNIPELKSRSGRVGILTDSPNKKTTNAVIAELNEREFGFVNGKGAFVPSRSTVRLPLTIKEDDIKKATSNAITEANQESIDKAIDVMGKACLEAIEGAFDTQGYGQWAPNAPATVKRKGSDTPMIDEGILREAYSYELD